MASTDLITGVSTTGTRPLPTTVQTSRTAGGTTLIAEALSGWETTTAVHFQTYKLDSGTGKKIPGSEQDWKADVSGNSFISLVKTSEGADTGNDIGDVIVAMPTAAWADQLAQGLLVEHKTTGGHKNITADSITNAGNYNQTTGTFTAPSGSISSITLANPYKFSAYNSNNTFTTVSSALTKMSFNTEMFDTGNNYDSTSLYRFTAPVNGFYMFTSTFLLNSPVSRLFTPFYKNGAEIFRGNDQNASAISVSNSMFIKLVAGDYIEVYYFTNSAVTVGSAPLQTSFSGYLVSTT